MSAVSGEIQKNVAASTSAMQATELKDVPVPSKVMKLLYQYAEQAILKGIQIGSKAFKNYIKNRLAQHDVSDQNIELAIQHADYSQLTERYIKDGKLVAKESQKYTLTSHAAERMSKPNLENVSLLFTKYSDQAKKLGIRSEKQCLAFLTEKIQPRNIQPAAVSEAIDKGRCQKLSGKRLKYTKGDLKVIVSEHDHSIITAYRSSIVKKKSDKLETNAVPLNKGSNVSVADSKTLTVSNAKSAAIK